MAEAKCVRRLTPGYIQQIDSYMRITNVQKASVFVASDTECFPYCPEFGVYQRSV